MKNHRRIDRSVRVTISARTSPKSSVNTRFCIELCNSANAAALAIMANRRPNSHIRAAPARGRAVPHTVRGLLPHQSMPSRYSPKLCGAGTPGAASVKWLQNKLSGTLISAPAQFAQIPKKNHKAASRREIGVRRKNAFTSGFLRQT